MQGRGVTSGASVVGVTVSCGFEPLVRVVFLISMQARACFLSGCKTRAFKVCDCNVAMHLGPFAISDDVNLDVDVFVW